MFLPVDSELKARPNLIFLAQSQTHRSFDKCLVNKRMATHIWHTKKNTVLIAHTVVQRKLYNMQI